MICSVDDDVAVRLRYLAHLVLVREGVALPLQGEEVAPLAVGNRILQQRLECCRLDHDLLPAS